MQFILTTLGKQALINAQQTGTNSVQIAQIGVGSGKYTASAGQTALVSEIKRLPIVSGGATGDNSIHVAFFDDSETAYSVYEVGLYLADSTLFAVYSSSNLILQKNAAAIAMLGVDIAFENTSVGNITFGDVTFSNAGAGTANAGIIAIATAEEVQAGESELKAVTPAGLASRTATEGRTGLVELATTAEVTTGTDTARAVTPAGVKAAIDARTATESRAGIVELATTAEVTAGTDTARAVTPAGVKAAFDGKLASTTETNTGTATDKAVTPASLASRVATDSRTGLVELTTDTEAQAGTDTNRAITPANLKATIDARLATNAETQTGTATDKAVTPASLASRTATESRTGIVELATTAEVTTGTDTSRAVTPAGVKAAIDARTATATAAGIVELATNAETTTGTDTARAVTPAGVKAAIDARTASASAKGIVELATNAEAVTGTDTARAVTPAGVQAVAADKMQDVVIDSSNRITNNEGKAAVSYYPSGLSGYQQQRAGANQLSLGRFSNDDSGNSLVFYKSRSATVNTSKSVQAGDKIAQINFMADNGNIDYSGTTQGARAAHIEAGIFESSSITSTGTGNVGIRGYVRIFCNSDENNRDGKGVEVIDNAFRPTEDNTANLGTAGRRFKAVYAVSDVISTSDQTKKQDITSIPDTVLNAWENVDFKQFRFIDDVLAEGENAKIFCGVIAQSVITAFENAGLDACAYGLVCEDTDDSGNTVYGVRYREAMVIENALNRRKLASLANKFQVVSKLPASPDSDTFYFVTEG